MGKDVLTQEALVEQLERAQREAAYYQRLSRQCGERRLKESEELSRIIEQLRQTEKELARSRDELEQRVQERTIELQQTNTQLDMLRATMNEISAYLDITRLMQVIVERAVALVGVTCGHIVISKPQNQQSTLGASVNLDPNNPRKCQFVAETTTAALKYMHQPSASNGKAPWEDYFGDNFLLVPLLTGGDLIGILGMYDENSDHRFHAAEQRLLSLFAQQAAIAIQNAHLYSSVHHLANVDPLTGLANRRCFFEMAEKIAIQARQNAKSLSIILLDIDHFKRINDTYGHLFGDEVLRQVAARCKANLRANDISARYGGEEVIVLLPQTCPTAAWFIAERIRLVIGRSAITCQQHILAATVTASLGVATWNGIGEINIERLIGQADQALYQAKSSGRNQVNMFRPG
ncbi:MAG: diguanylate cyclase [Chloroflexaceae bacterium]|nr:diguanylate cyclase [Chloroflexaceae bacterium]